MLKIKIGYDVISTERLINTDNRTGKVVMIIDKVT
jgi:hypothetical protein